MRHLTRKTETRYRCGDKADRRDLSYTETKVIDIELWPRWLAATL
jgi:hypothetical protein